MPSARSRSLHEEYAIKRRGECSTVLRRVTLMKFRALSIDERYVYTSASMLCCR